MADASRAASRVGLLGGTFNPIHLAHLRAAEEVREACALDRVDFVLSAAPPHKRDDDVAAVAHRLRMLELALAGHPGFTVDASEVARPGRSYSVDTLRAARARAPGTAYTFIVGADAFLEIETWKEYAAIFTLCDVCVMSRPGSDATRPPIAVAEAFWYDPKREVWVHRSGSLLRFLPITALVISASDIRRRRAAGRSIRYLVPDAVRAYIERQALYAPGDPAR